MAENPLPEAIAKTSITPYILGVGGLLALVAIFTLGVLWLRPQVDAMALMGQIGLLLGAAIPGILAFIRSGQSIEVSKATYHINNSAIEEFKSTLVEKARMEGAVQGAADEKASAAVTDAATVKGKLARAEGILAGQASAPAVQAAPTAMAVNGPGVTDAALAHSAEAQGKAAAVQIAAAAEQLHAAAEQNKAVKPKETP